jgi:O-glycosyl hydrolase
MPGPFRMRNFLAQASVKGFRVISATRKIEVRTEQPTEIIIQKGNPRFGNANDKIYLGIMVGHTKDGQTAEKTFMLKASGEIDRTPVQITIDPQKPGRKFDGIGGNFRIQNETLDSLVIDYCLDNLHVRWARVELPWRNWHLVESNDPLEAARAGKIDENVRSAMEMAQKLSKRNIPIIMSAWNPPTWSIVGEPNFRNENGIFGNPLNPKKMRSILKSIGEYFVYLKEAFGVEPELFSFNESDLGINVRMTGQEHAEFIKKLGEYLASKELTTKMLLGDNSDATTIDFIEPALQDPSTHNYIGAISFHTWRGCDNWALSNWADASKELNVPLLIGEGGTDAQAHMNPDVFQEPSFAQDEVDIYIRACNVAHVKSILQWQLTSDYSLLSGGGIYRTEGPLHPTQRFWNLKQLGMVSPGSFILPITCDKEGISCAAFGDIANENYTVHIVNQGASRLAYLTGLPANVKEFRVYITDSKHGMEEGKRVRVSDGKAKFMLSEFAFISVISAK